MFQNDIFVPYHSLCNLLLCNIFLKILLAKEINITQNFLIVIQYVHLELHQVMTIQKLNYYIHN